MTSGGVSSDSLLKCQTLALKVSIHCEGCKKKVHKILKGIPGVYDIEIDARMNRVTVKSIVDAGTLVRRLEKSGKHAELWPQCKPSKHLPPAAGAGTGDKKEKEKEKESKEKPKEKDLPPPEKYDKKKPEADAVARANAKSRSQAEPPSKPQNKREGGLEKQHKLGSDSKKTGDAATRDAAATAAAVCVDGGNEKEAGNSGTGKKGKKKAQKEMEIDDETPQRNSDCRSADSPPPQHQNQNHQQQQHMYSSYPPPYPPHPAVPYVASYNMAQPSVSQAYYAPPAPAPAPAHGYTYAPYAYTPPPEHYGGHPAPFAGGPASWTPQPLPHDNVFSDENPNSCSLM